MLNLLAKHDYLSICGKAFIFIWTDIFLIGVQNVGLKEYP